MAGRAPVMVCALAGLVACQSHVRESSGARDTAIDVHRPPGLKVQLAYQVGPAPDCSNWYAALRKAREWAACDRATNTNLVKNPCQERIQGCARGCDICPLIAPGAGPPAYFEDLGQLSRDSANRNVIIGTRGMQSVWRHSFVFNRQLCDDISWVDVLGSTIVHEAMHYCHGGYGISDFASNQSGCAANGLERFCTGIPSKGGL